MKFLQSCVCFCLLGLLSACSILPATSSTSNLNRAMRLQPPQLQHELFTPVAVDSADLFSLTTQQEQHFLSFYHAPVNQKYPRHKRIFEYISHFYKDYSYYGKTFTASETLEKKQGNCLSLVLMSSALTELVGLRYKYRRVHSKPVFERFGGVMTVGGHINFTVINQLKAGPVQLLFPAAITIDYFPSPDSVSGDIIDRNTIIAMFYQNKAAEAMINQQWDIAFAYAQKAFAKDPYNPETLNIIAVLYNKRGASGEAESLYAFMFEHHLLSLAAVDNYSDLLNRLGKSSQATALLEKYDGLEDENPYEWLNRASQFLQNNELRLAEKYTLRSIKQAPYLHEAQYQLARIYWQQSRYQQARTALQKAMELAYRPSDESRYSGKLYWMQQQLSSG